MKTVRNLLATALLLTGAAACTNETPQYSYTADPKAVRIAPTVGSGSIFSRSNPIGSTAEEQMRFNAGDRIAVAAAINADATPQPTATYTLGADGTTWTPDAATPYLRWTAATMNFAAYYPAGTDGTSMTTFAVPTDQTTPDKIALADYMTFSGEKSKPATTGEGIELGMQRQMARIIIHATLNSEFAGTEDITNLTIASPANLAPSSATVRISPYTAAAGTRSYTAVVIPGMSMGAAGFITLTIDGRQLSAPLTQPIASGKSYTFALGVGKDRLTIGEVTVTPWADATLEGGEATLPVPLYYTSTDGEIVTPANPDGFGAKILSNTYADGQGTIVFDSHVTKIAEYAFGGCATLASINIPESVRVIGDGFRYCRSLTSIAIPKGVRNVDPTTFEYCTSLTSITVDAENTVYDSRDNCNAIIHTATNRLTAGCQSTVIPPTVKSIGNYAFYVCNSLASIDIPEGVESIGTDAFTGCGSLASITLPTSVEAIGANAFQACSSLASITLPTSVESIGRGAFMGCSSLATVYCSPTVPPTLGNNVFSGTPRTLKIYVPSASAAAYQAANSWTEWASYIADVATAPTEQPTIR